MNQSKIIGLTGSIATGKSQVSKYLKGKGIKVVDADLIARDVANYKSVKNKIKKVFGDDLYINDQLDRKKLAEIIFEKKIHRQKLNDIMHPEIYSFIFKEKGYIHKDEVFLAPSLFIYLFVNFWLRLKRFLVPRFMPQ